MTLADWLMIAAVLLSPLIAIQVQKAIERWREGRERKSLIFKSLMATRGSRLSPRYVEALNMIDLEFTSKKKPEKRVIDAWKVYRDHLYSAPQDREKPDYETKFQSWNDKTDEYQADLLAAMSECLGYGFDKVYLKKGFYAPQGHADVEFDHFLLRRGMVELLYGRRSLPIHATQPPATQPNAQTNQSEPSGAGNGHVASPQNNPPEKDVSH